MREWGKDIWAECEDTYRKQVGWKGEMALFRAARAQHTVTHPDLGERGCEICKVIIKHLTRLTMEGTLVAESIYNSDGSFYSGQG